MDRKDPLKVLQGHKTFEKSSKIEDTYKNGDRKPYEGLPRIPVLIKASFRQKIFQRSSGDRSIFKRLIKIKKKTFQRISKGTFCGQKNLVKTEGLIKLFLGIENLLEAFCRYETFFPSCFYRTPYGGFL